MLVIQSKQLHSNLIEFSLFLPIQKILVKDTIPLTLRELT